MCGIGGVLIFPKERDEKELLFISELAKSIAVENQVRGKDATGFAFFGNSGKVGYGSIKAPLPAEDFVEKSTFQEYLKDNLTLDTKNILIHTRAGTQGSESNNDNNHPIISTKYIGIHNGMIYNDGQLFEDHRLFRLAEVDSEVIFRLLDKYGDSISRVKKVSELISGMFTYAFVPKDKSRHNELTLVKGNNPVTLVYVPKLNIIAFASKKEFLEHALFDADFKFDLEMLNSYDEFIWLDPKDCSIMRFDTNANNPLEQLSQSPTFFEENYGGYYYRNSSYDDFWDDGYGLNVSGFSTSGVAGEEDEIVPNINEEFNSVLSRLSPEEIRIIDQKIDEMYDMGWHQGYGDGRDSLSEEIDQKKDFEYERGYKEGFEDGYKERREALEEAN